MNTYGGVSTEYAGKSGIWMTTCCGCDVLDCFDTELPIGICAGCRDWAALEFEEDLEEEE